MDQTEHFYNRAVSHAEADDGLAIRESNECRG
jgi:hypothetical protein